MSGPSHPDYLGQKAIVYERDRLQLRSQPDTVQQGETIIFEISHTGDSEAIFLGCHIPWAIQIYEGGEWKHAVWTDERYYNMCATQIGPGDTISLKVPLSQPALSGKDGLGEVAFEFTPGKYQFILVGTTPQLAVDFRIMSSGE